MDPKMSELSHVLAFWAKCEKALSSNEAGDENIMSLKPSFSANFCSDNALSCHDMLVTLVEVKQSTAQLLPADDRI